MTKETAHPREDAEAGKLASAAPEEASPKVPSRGNESATAAAPVDIATIPLLSDDAIALVGEPGNDAVAESPAGKAPLAEPTQPEPTATAEPGIAAEEEAVTTQPAEENAAEPSARDESTAAAAEIPPEPAEAAPAEPSVLLILSGVTRQFGETRALDGIDLELRRGEIVALLGENGAGKTTLLNILAGRVRRSAGTIFLQRKGRRPKSLAPSPSRALAAGIAFVDAEPTLAGNLTALENIMLGRQSLWRPRLSRSGARRKIDGLMKRLDLRIDLDVLVAELPADGRFGVKMLRALYGDARILMLDEPTGALTSQDAETLFRTLKRLAAEGVCVIVATRKPEEALVLADRIVILREGRKLVETAGTNRSEVETLVRAGAPHKSRPSFHATGDSILELRQVNVTSDDPRASLHRVSLEIRAGEIIGIAGLAGNGQETLTDLIAGLVAPTSGEMRLFGRRLARFEPAAFLRAGIVGTPPDRRMGIVADMSIAENLVLEDFSREWFNRYGVLDYETIHRHAREIIVDHLIDCPEPDSPAGGLTSRQIDKLVLARALDRKPRLFVASQPTRGLDGARAAEVQRQIEIERESGAAVIWISEDIDELLAHADAISVLHEGRLSVPQPTGAFDPRTLGHMMGGHGSLAQDWHGWGHDT